MEELLKINTLSLIKKVLLFLSVCFMVSCDSKMPIHEDPVIKINILYEDSNGKLLPDTGAIIYIYYDIYSVDLAGFDHVGDGVFEKRGIIIKPDQRATADSNGEVLISPNYIDKKFTIITESNFYKNRMTNSNYSSCQNDIVETIFHLP